MGTGRGCHLLQGHPQTPPQRFTQRRPPDVCPQLNAASFSPETPTLGSSGCPPVTSADVSFWGCLSVSRDSERGKVPTPHACSRPALASVAPQGPRTLGSKPSPCRATCKAQQGCEPDHNPLGYVCGRPAGLQHPARVTGTPLCAPEQARGEAGVLSASAYTGPHPQSARLVPAELCLYPDPKSFQRACSSSWDSCVPASQRPVGQGPVS